MLHIVLKLKQDKVTDRRTKRQLYASPFGEHNIVAPYILEGGHGYLV